MKKLTVTRSDLGLPSNWDSSKPVSVVLTYSADANVFSKRKDWEFPVATLYESLTFPISGRSDSMLVTIRVEQGDRFVMRYYMLRGARDGYYNLNDLSTAEIPTGSGGSSGPAPTLESLGAVSTSDSRLSDSRTPKAHTHNEYLTDAEGDAKYSAKNHTHTGYATTSHTHDQYLDQTEGDSLYAHRSHNHTASEITNLSEQLDDFLTSTTIEPLLNEKADKSNTYTKSEVDDAVAEAEDTSWSEITDKPTTFPPDLTGVTAATVGAYATRNVRAYGATGNGSDDDTAAIQAAIDAGGMVTFDPGTYRITAPLVLKSGTILQGCHAPSYSPDVNPTTAGSKIIAANGYTGTSMVSVAGNAWGCAIYNMLICGNNQGSDVHGIGLPQTIPGELSFRMRDVQIAGMSGAGMEGSLHVGQLYGVHIGRCGSNAVRVTGSNRWVDVKVIGMFAYFNARSAIYFAGGHTGAVEFSMCRFERSGQTYGDPDNVGGGFNADEAGVRIRRGQFLSFLSCTTDANTGAGFHIDGQTNAASQLTDISFTQCRASRDGGGDQSGTFEGAGFLVSAFSEVEANRPRRMSFTACTTSTGLSNDGGGSGPISPRRGLSNTGAWQTVWHGRIPQVAGGGTAFHLSGDNYGTSIFYADDEGRTFVWRPHVGAATQVGI